MPKRKSVSENTGNSYNEAINLSQKINELKKQESAWNNRLETCEACIEAIFRYIEKDGDESLLVLEDIINEFHKMA